MKLSPAPAPRQSSYHRLICELNTYPPAPAPSKDDMTAALALNISMTIFHRNQAHRYHMYRYLYLCLPPPVSTSSSHTTDLRCRTCILSRDAAHVRHNLTSESRI
jgi:hypothetical protein